MNKPIKMCDSVARIDCKGCGKHASDHTVRVTEMIELKNQENGI